MLRPLLLLLTHCLSGPASHAHACVMKPMVNLTAAVRWSARWDHSASVPILAHKFRILPTIPPQSQGCSSADIVADPQAMACMCR